jgi:8-oxo-dGTP diphosphatase
MKKGEDYTGVTVVYCCHDKEGNVLMAKRSKNCRDEHGRWDIGGGGVEFRDKVEDTLKKEIAEEYCTEVLSFDFLGYRDVHREHQGKKTHWIALDFKVLVEKNKVKIGEPHKFDSIGWFNLDTIPNEIHSQLPTFFENYKDKIFN